MKKLTGMLAACAIAAALSVTAALAEIRTVTLSVSGMT